MELLAVFGCAIVLASACFWTLKSLRPQPESLHEIVTGFSTRPRGSAMSQALPVAPSGWDQARSFFVALLWREPSEGLSMDLAICATTMEQHLLERIAGPLLVLALSIPGNALLSVAGVPLDPIFAVLFTALLVVLAALVPGLMLERRARRHRLAYRHALSAYLDLVTILMAGGAGLVGALNEAVEAGEGDAFASIRSSLTRSQLAGIPAWEGLRELGQRIGVAELEDVSNTLDLAGEHGARVVEALSAQGDSLRQQLRHEIESDAERASERLLVPSAMLLLPLLLFFVPALISMFGQSAGLAPTTSQVLVGP